MAETKDFDIYQLDMSGDDIKAKLQKVQWNPITYKTIIDRLYISSDKTDEVLDDNSLDGKKLKNKSVSTEQINDSAITTVKIDDDAVTAIKILNGSINKDKLATDAVITAKIKDGAVTNDKLAGEISADKLAGGITNDKLAGEISADKLAGGISYEKLTGTIPETHIATESIDNTKLKKSTITINDEPVALGGTLSIHLSEATNLKNGTGNLSISQVSAATNTNSYANSAAFGLATYATAENQMVCGMYNTKAETALFVVGCGDNNDSPSNALEVSKTSLLIPGGAILATDTANDTITVNNKQVPLINYDSDNEYSWIDLPDTAVDGTISAEKFNLSTGLINILSTDNSVQFFARKTDKAETENLTSYTKIMGPKTDWGDIKATVNLPIISGTLAVREDIIDTLNNAGLVTYTTSGTVLNISKVTFQK